MWVLNIAVPPTQTSKSYQDVPDVTAWILYHKVSCGNVWAERYSGRCSLAFNDRSAFFKHLARYCHSSPLIRDNDASLNQRECSPIDLTEINTARYLEISEYGLQSILCEHLDLLYNVLFSHSTTNALTKDAKGSSTLVAMRQATEVVTT